MQAQCGYITKIFVSKGLGGIILHMSHYTLLLVAFFKNLFVYVIIRLGTPEEARNGAMFLQASKDFGKCKRYF